MRISDWSSDVCSSDLLIGFCGFHHPALVKQCQADVVGSISLPPANGEVVLLRRGPLLYHGIIGAVGTVTELPIPFRIKVPVATIYCGIVIIDDSAIFFLPDRQSTRLNSSH